MKIIVQKFGGSSVASEESRLAVKEKVQQAIKNGYAPVVVVPQSTQPSLLQSITVMSML